MNIVGLVEAPRRKILHSAKMADISDEIAAERLIAAKGWGLLYDVETGELITTSTANETGKVINSSNSVTASSPEALKSFFSAMKNDFEIRYYESGLEVNDDYSLFIIHLKPSIRDFLEGGEERVPTQDEWLSLGQTLTHIANGKDDQPTILRYSYSPKSNLASLTIAYTGVTDHGQKANELRGSYDMKNNIQFGKNGRLHLTVTSVEVQYPKSSDRAVIRIVKDYTNTSYAIIGDIDKLPESIKNQPYFVYNKYLTFGPGLVSPLRTYDATREALSRQNNVQLEELTKKQAENKRYSSVVSYGDAMIPSAKDEDRVYVSRHGHHLFAAVFDGHGGRNIVKQIVANVSKLESLAINFPKSLNVAVRQGTKAFLDMDELLRSHEDSLYQGATGLIAAINLMSGKVFFYHVGDSRAVWQLVPKTEIGETSDHKPESEIERIKEAGGYVTSADVPRVNDTLAMSRAFGDFALKMDQRNGKSFSADPVSRIPEVDGPYDIAPGGVIVLASDGVWDVLENSEAIDLARSVSDAKRSAQIIVEKSKNLGSRDDISAIVIKFGK